MASEIHLRLYEELNDFLAPGKRKKRFSCPLRGINTVKDLLNSINVPEENVELVLVNGVSAGFSSPLNPDDFVSVYPVFESLDIKPLLRLRDKPLRQTRFLTCAGLARLAACLRKLGFDARDADSRELEDIIRVAEEERRIVLTRNPALLKSAELSRVLLVCASRPKEQLIAVIARFNLSGKTE
jgi:uncharacterized protein